MDFISFDELYNILQPTFARLEIKRQESVKKIVRQASVGGIIIFVLLLLILVLCKAGFGNSLLVGFIAGALTFLFMLLRNDRSYIVEYKNQVVLFVVQSLIAGSRYEPLGGISESLFCKCGLFGTLPDRYSAEDLITGTVGRTDIKFSEVHAEEKYVTTNGKGVTTEHWRDIFKGIIFVADFHKDFIGHTIVVRNGWGSFSRKGKVKHENREFDKTFNTYSTDQVEARYILTPTMMERMVELDKRLKGSNVIFSFFESDVIIAVSSSSNRFEASVWRKPEANRKTLLTEYNFLLSMVQVVDDLNLNTRIWTKK